MKKLFSTRYVSTQVGIYQKSVKILQLVCKAENYLERQFIGLIRVFILKILCVRLSFLGLCAENVDIL
jgi:hypothetical protein